MAGGKEKDGKSDKEAATYFVLYEGSAKAEASVVPFSWELAGRKHAEGNPGVDECCSYCFIRV
jgi:hypothetical protein